MWRVLGVCTTTKDEDERAVESVGRYETRAVRRRQRDENNATAPAKGADGSTCTQGRVSQSGVAGRPAARPSRWNVNVTRPTLAHQLGAVKVAVTCSLAPAARRTTAASDRAARRLHPRYTHGDCPIGIWSCGAACFGSLRLARRRRGDFKSRRGAVEWWWHGPGFRIACMHGAVVDGFAHNALRLWPGLYSLPTHPDSRPALGPADVYAIHDV